MISARHESPVVITFDVEEHYRIEAAAGIECADDDKRMYADRMEQTTRFLLDRLAAHDVKATFFIVGQIAESHPQLIREIAASGHEVGMHGWDHRRVHRFDPNGFREDLRKTKDALEQASGSPVAGYRAPTFSIGKETAWAVDVLFESGVQYDSSIYPVRHAFYGVPSAPRTPFLLQGERGTILELPPATYRMLGRNFPIGGGGWFRLFPLAFMQAGIDQLAGEDNGIGVLYFHPWEFDPDQPQLPLRRLSRFRTYVGIGKSRERLERLLTRRHHQCRRMIDVVRELEAKREGLPKFRLT